MNQRLHMIKEPEVTIVLSTRTYIRLHNAVLESMSNKGVAVFERTILSFLNEYFDSQHVFYPESFPSVEINLVEVVSDVLYKSPYGTKYPNYVDVVAEISGVSFEPLENYSVMVRESFNTPKWQNRFLNMIHLAARKCDDNDANCMAGSYFNSVNDVEGFSLYELPGGSHSTPELPEGTVEDEVETLPAHEAMGTYDIGSSITQSLADSKTHEQNMAHNDIQRFRRIQSKDGKNPILNDIYLLVVLSCLCLTLVKLKLYGKNKSVVVFSEIKDDGNAMEKNINRSVECIINPKGILKNPTVNSTDFLSDGSKIV